MTSENNLSNKVREVREQTLLLHKRAPGTRIASSLSPVEFLVALYYNSPLQVDPDNLLWEQRDRLIMSKGHGVVSLYPILADRGFYEAGELENISTQDSFLGVIPDAGVPGIESTHGALGHGPGLGLGMAMALKHQNNPAQVCILCGDGEMNEGSIWEAVMLAPKHQLDNMLLVVDDNKQSMLGFQKDFFTPTPFAQKLSAFGWDTTTCPGHDVQAIASYLQQVWRQPNNGQPRALVLETIKGYGVEALMGKELSHVLSLSPEQVDEAITALERDQ
ncbi:1-deoxy-D-xylulose-5-phosphate synthase N-terminal domain-containing protein [Magnetococcus sp. PR-3]|uniref:1-deoxy-D-xylulose-5-phosphate synthase N-terminal domain-containing protein n=1 Tax=Magnetococcus sp. PR-3 TaxID=3120355 RepID=UPI002FCDF640